MKPVIPDILMYFDGGDVGMVRISKRRRRFIMGVHMAVAVGLVFYVISHFNLLHGIYLKIGDFLRPATTSIAYLSILLLVVLCSLLVLRFRVLWAALSTVFLGIINILAAFYFFYQGTVIDKLYPPMARVRGNGQVTDIRQEVNNG
jgi:hypothetical protein